MTTTDRTTTTPTEDEIPATERDLGRDEPRTPGWRVVALREISVKLRDKAFVFSTVFLLVVSAAGVGVSEFVSQRTSSDTVAVVDAAGADVVEAGNQLAADADQNRELTVQETAGADEAQALVREGDVDAALLPVAGGEDGADGARWEVVGQTGVDGGLAELLREAVAAEVLAENAQSAGTTAESLTAGTVLAERVLDEGALPEGLQAVIGFAFALLFYLAALTFGLAIAQSVVEEKQSRVVEILVAAVPVRQLLAGKVIGNSVLAIAQVVLLVGVGLVALSVTGQAGTVSPILSAGGWFVVFFLLGFGALACLWAVAGSVSTRQEDLQSTSTPMTFVVIAALFGGLFASGPAQTVLSFVPLVSTVAMPSRLLAGDVPLWQPVVSALIVAVTAVLLVRLGARLYEGSVLQTGRRVKLSEAFSRSGS